MKILGVLSHCVCIGRDANGEQGMLNVERDS